MCLLRFFFFGSNAFCTLDVRTWTVLFIIMFIIIKKKTNKIQQILEKLVLVLVF